MSHGDSFEYFNSSSASLYEKKKKSLNTPAPVKFSLHCSDRHGEQGKVRIADGSTHGTHTNYTKRYLTLAAVRYTLLCLCKTVLLQLLFFLSFAIVKCLLCLEAFLEREEAQKIEADKTQKCDF